MEAVKVAPEVDSWEFSRQLQKYGSLENRDRFNNWRILDIKLWSSDSRVDRLVEALSLMMWGKSHKRRMDHLRVILVNLVKIYGHDPYMYLGYHRGKTRYWELIQRYNPAKVTELTIIVMNGLIENKLIENYRGRFNVAHGKGYVSKARPTDNLVGLWTAYGINESLVTTHPNTELVELRTERGTEWKNGKMNKPKGKSKFYSDTPMTEGMRTFLESYNDYLAGVTFEYQGAIRNPDYTRRIFNGGWDQGGRFYGGFWQRINEIRRSTILIDEEPVVELDYGCLHPTLVYASIGLKPSGDIYDLNDVPRKAIKEAFMRMINNKTRGHAVNGLREYLKKNNIEGLNASDILTRLEAKHDPIRGYFYKGLGLNLLRTDSNICELVLKTMTDESIACLSVFDSFIVPVRYEDNLRETMILAFWEITGVDYEPVIK